MRRNILLQKNYSKNKRNNANSVGSDNCCTINISRNNNKSSVWIKWSDKESTRQ